LCKASGLARSRRSLGEPYSIDKLEDYDQPLVVKLDVKGRLGYSTGKRLLIPGDIFEATAKPTFPDEKRGEIIYKTEGYPELRSFYSKMENKDQEAIVLTSAPSATRPTPAGN
jgi:hypothetical protein